MSFNIKEYAVEAAKKYAVNSAMSDNSYRHDNVPRREHMVPYGPSMADSSYERRVIEKPVVYECVETEIIRPVHQHQHQQYYEPERRVEYVEYERGTEFDRDGRSLYETDGYVKHGRVFGGY